jgi:nicotinate phosphoribosyltransferase
VEAANGKNVLYFPARFDHWAVQGGDGYAAHIGGATGVSTDAQAQWWGAKASGTVPHALIAAVGGDTVKAVTLFGETYPEVDLVALVDFDNDCVETSLKCCEALGDRLWGVRLDTSESLVDKSVVPVMQNFTPVGVTPKLVEITRRTLDNHGFSHVKIIVSGGFAPDKIVDFEKRQVPVDVYGVGNYLMRGVNAFTADIVLLEGQPCAKVGREYNPNPRLELVNL